MLLKKTNNLSDKHRQWGFRVQVHATKAQIKAAVEKCFSVKVVSVTTLNQQGKKRGKGLHRGRQNHWKKAYVALQQGYELNFIED